MDKLIGMLSLARRAGKLKAGYDVVLEAAQGGEARLVLMCPDLSPRTQRSFRTELSRMASAPRVADIEETMEQLAPVLGRRAGILAICDDSFAAGIGRLIPDGDNDRIQEEQ